MLQTCTLILIYRDKEGLQKWNIAYLEYSCSILEIFSRIREIVYEISFKKEVK